MLREENDLQQRGHRGSELWVQSVAGMEEDAQRTRLDARPQKPA